jgi:hypothetical protein
MGEVLCFGGGDGRKNQSSSYGIKYQVSSIKYQLINLLFFASAYGNTPIGALQLGLTAISS